MQQNQPLRIMKDSTKSSDLVTSITSKSLVPHAKDLDKAYWFISHAKAETSQSTTIDPASFRRKIDWRIVPVLLLCYTMSYIDKALINYAAVMGLNRDLHLRGNEFSNTASWFFLAYLLAEIPNGYFLQMVSPRKWLAGNVILWGIATACTAAAQGYHSLLAARIFLGIFEAAIAPTGVLITSQWYTKPEQALRSNFWACGVGLGQILGSFFSWAFQQVHGAEIASWRIMFLVLGAVTTVAGLVAYWIVPDNPMTATFLDKAEKVSLLEHVSVNRTGVENRHFKWSHIKELVVDIQIWLLVVITILVRFHFLLPLYQTLQS